MAKFRYTARTIEGKKRLGIKDAQDEAELYNKLRTENLFMINASPLLVKGYGKRIKAKPLSEFCRELGTLLSAGISLIRALNIISQAETNKPWQRTIYQKLQHSIRQGLSLSEAMEQQEGVFPELIIYMFRSAELAGNMDQTALRLAGQYEKEHRISSKIKNAMIYPMVILCVCVIAVIILTTVVIPMFADMFALMEELPLSTRIIIGFSNILTNYWVYLAVAIAGLVMLVRAVFLIPGVRISKDRLKLKLPVFGSLLSVIYTARFTRTLSSLYSSGVPIISALQIGKRTIGNAYLEAQFDEAITIVRQGGSLSVALGSIDGFTKKLSASVLIGEETGRLDTMLNSIADDLDYSADVSISRLTALMEPLLILVMAMIVGFILISIVSPMMGMYGAIENTSGL